MNGPLTERDILALLALFVALLELTRLRWQVGKLGRGDQQRQRSKDSDGFDRSPYFGDSYKERPTQRRISRLRKLGREKPPMAENFGNWLASEEHFEREVEDRKGNKTTIYIREFAEEDLEKRDSVMIDQGNRRNRRGRQSGEIELKVENRRKFDLFEGVVDWDAMVPKTNSKGKPVDADGNETTDPEQMVPVKLECTRKNKLKLSGYVSEQMIREVREINDLPTDDEDLKDDDKKDDNKKDDGYSGNGFDNSGYFGGGDEEEGEDPQMQAASGRTSDPQ